MFHDQFLPTTPAPCRDSGTTFLCVDYVQGSFDDLTVRWNVTPVIDLVIQLELDLLKDIGRDRSYPSVCSVAVDGRGADWVQFEGGVRLLEWNGGECENPGVHGRPPLKAIHGWEVERRYMKFEDRS